MRMLEHLGAMRAWQSAGRRLCVATLVEARDSTPRDPGASMLIAQDGELCGSLTGGCVEAALVEEAGRVFAGGGVRIPTYGISDSQAQEVGLSCGGTLSILVDEPGAPYVRDLHAALEQKRQLLATAVALNAAYAGKRIAIFVNGTIGSLGNPELDAAVCAEVRGAAALAEASVRTFGESGEPHGDLRIFIERVVRPPEMYVFGAIDFAAALIDVGKLLGYRVTLCDARPPFATAERFPNADRIAVAWPDDFLREAHVDERSAIIAMTHDEKFDVPLLRAALETSAGYIGVLGSRRTNARRMEQLRELGVPAEQIARLSAPIGLDIGARTPQETAIAIAAEIVALRNGRSGERLTGGSGTLRGRR